MNERLRDCHVLVGVKDDSLNNMLGAEQHTQDIQGVER